MNVKLRQKPRASDFTTSQGWTTALLAYERAVTEALYDVILLSLEDSNGHGDERFYNVLNQIKASGWKR